MHYVSVFRVAAKPHRCWLCGDEIVKGSRYIDTTSIQKGQYDTWKHHVPCQALLDAEPDDDQHPERDAEGDPESAEDRRLADLDDVRRPVEHEQVEEEQEADERQEGDPVDRLDAR